MNTRFACVIDELPEYVHLEPGMQQTYVGDEFLNKVKNILKMAHRFVDGLSEQAQKDFKITHFVSSIDRAESLIHFIETSPEEEKLHNFDGIVTQLASEAYYLNTRLCSDMHASDLYEDAILKMRADLSLAEVRLKKTLPDHQAIVDQLSDSLFNTTIYHDVRDLTNYKLALRVSSILGNMEASRIPAISGEGIAVGAAGTLLLSAFLLRALRTPVAKYIGDKFFLFGSTMVNRFGMFAPKLEAATAEETMGLQSEAGVEMGRCKVI